MPNMIGVAMENTYNLIDDFVRRSQFMQWGDERIMAAAKQVVDAEYYRDRGISFGSLHKLLVHMMGAQWIWLERWKGNSPPKLLGAEDYPTRDGIDKYWPGLHRDFITFIQAQWEPDIHRPIQYKNSRGQEFIMRLSELIYHALDHGTYHRGQANTLIKLAGGTPVSVNYFEYSLLCQASGTRNRIE